MQLLTCERTSWVLVCRMEVVTLVDKASPCLSRSRMSLMARSALKKTGISEERAIIKESKRCESFLCKMRNVFESLRELSALPLDSPLRGSHPLNLTNYYAQNPCASLSKKRTHYPTCTIPISSATSTPSVLYFNKPPTTRIFHSTRGISRPCESCRLLLPLLDSHTLRRYSISLSRP